MCQGEETVYNSFLFLSHPLTFAYPFTPSCLSSYTISTDTTPISFSRYRAIVMSCEFRSNRETSWTKDAIVRKWVLHYSASSKSRQRPILASKLSKDFRLQAHQKWFGGRLIKGKCLLNHRYCRIIISQLLIEYRFFLTITYKLFTSTILLP